MLHALTVHTCMMVNLSSESLSTKLHLSSKLHDLVTGVRLVNVTRILCNPRILSISDEVREWTNVTALWMRMISV